jgi:RsiW-degrading membrane proteinase PrsW (M82 family)
MKNHLYHTLIAFFGGLFGVSILFIVLHLITVNVGYLENVFPPTPLGRLLFILIVVSFIEESVKFLLIKRDIGQFPYGFLLGFGFGAGEAVLKYPFWEIGAVPASRSGAIILHIITAGIICYFVKKDKPVLGLAIAIVIHTGFDLLANWTIR